MEDVDHAMFAATSLSTFFFGREKWMHPGKSSDNSPSSGKPVTPQPLMHWLSLGLLACLGGTTRKPWPRCKPTRRSISGATNLRRKPIYHEALKRGAQKKTTKNLLQPKFHLGDCLGLDNVGVDMHCLTTPHCAPQDFLDSLHRTTIFWTQSTQSGFDTPDFVLANLGSLTPPPTTVLLGSPPSSNSLMPWAIARKGGDVSATPSPIHLLGAPRPATLCGP